MEPVKMYSTVVGWVALVLAVLGFAMGGLGSFLVYGTAQSIVYLVVAAILLYAAYGAEEELGTTLVKVVGVVLLLVGILGFVNSDLWGLLPGLEMYKNVLHLVLGAWGAYAGWSA